MAIKSIPQNIATYPIVEQLLFFHIMANNIKILRINPGINIFKENFRLDRIETPLENFINFKLNKYSLTFKDTQNLIEIPKELFDEITKYRYGFLYFVNYFFNKIKKTEEELKTEILKEVSSGYLVVNGLFDFKNSKKIFKNWIYKNNRFVPTRPIQKKYNLSIGKNIGKFTIKKIEKDFICLQSLNKTLLKYYTDEYELHKFLKELEEETENKI